MPSIVGRCCPLGGHFAALCQNVWFIRRFADSEHGLDEVEKRILASWAGCSSPNTRAFIHHQPTCVRSISFRFWLVSFHQMGKREQKLRLAMGEKKRSKLRKRYEAEYASFVRFCLLYRWKFMRQEEKIIRQTTESQITKVFETLSSPLLLEKLAC